MLTELSVLIRREHVAPRDGVTVLAQLTAGSFGTGWAYYATNIAVTVVPALAANTSFGGLPVLMSLLSDDWLPHLFGLRAERPAHRYGVVALVVLAAVLLIAVNAVTSKLIPLYAIGVDVEELGDDHPAARFDERARSGELPASRGFGVLPVLGGYPAVEGEARASGDELTSASRSAICLSNRLSPSGISVPS